MPELNIQNPIEDIKKLNGWTIEDAFIQGASLRLVIAHPAAAKKVAFTLLAVYTIEIRGQTVIMNPGLNMGTQDIG